MQNTAIVKTHNISRPQTEGQFEPRVIRQLIKPSKRRISRAHIFIRHIRKGANRIKSTNCGYSLATEEIDDGRRESMINPWAAVKKYPAPGAQNFVIIRSRRLEFLDQCGTVSQRRLTAIRLVNQAMQKLKARGYFPSG